MSNQPLRKWRSGNISGAVWLNEKDVNGTKVNFKTASLRRSWKKEGDIWRDEVLNFRRQDLPKLLSIINEMQKELYLGESKGGVEDE